MTKFLLLIPILLLAGFVGQARADDGDGELSTVYYCHDNGDGTYQGYQTTAENPEAVDIVKLHRSHPDDLFSYGGSPCPTPPPPCPSVYLPEFPYSERPDCESPSSTPTPSPSCQEDDPCWDCETMGNKECGPTEAVPTPTETVPTPEPHRTHDERPHELDPTPSAPAVAPELTELAYTGASDALLWLAVFGLALIAGGALVMWRSEAILREEAEEALDDYRRAVVKYVQDVVKDA